MSLWSPFKSLTRRDHLTVIMKPFRLKNILKSQKCLKEKNQIFQNLKGIKRTVFLIQQDANCGYNGNITGFVSYKSRVWWGCGTVLCARQALLLLCMNKAGKLQKAPLRSSPPVLLAHSSSCACQARHATPHPCWTPSLPMTYSHPTHQAGHLRAT